MIAHNLEIELDPAADPVTELFGFTMSPRGLRVRLHERAPAPRVGSWDSGSQPAGLSGESAFG